MDSARWQILALLAMALVGTVAYMALLAKRLRRMKEILDRTPREAIPAKPAQTPGAGAVRPPPIAALAPPPVGSMLGTDVEWVDEQVQAQQLLAASEKLGTGPDRAAGEGKSASLAEMFHPRQAAPAATEGELLKKLLSFDSGGAAPVPAQQPAPPAWPDLARAAPPPGERPKVPELFGGGGSAALPMPPLVVPRPDPAPPMGPGVFGRLGAFSDPDVGAPESAIAKPPPLIRAPSISLGNLVGPSPPAGDDAASAKPTAGLSARLKIEDLAKGRDAAEVASRDRGVSIGEAIEGEERPEREAEPQAPGRSPLAALGLEAPAPPPAGRPGSILGRAGSSDGPRAAPPASPMGSLMARLGGGPPAAPKPGEPEPAREESKGPSALSALDSLSLGGKSETAATRGIAPAQPGAVGSLLARFGKPAAGGETESARQPSKAPAGLSLQARLAPAAPRQTPALPPGGSPLDRLFQAPTAPAKGPEVPAGLPSVAPSPSGSAAAASLLAKFGKPKPAPPPPAAGPSTPQLPSDIGALEQLFVDNPDDSVVAQALAAAYAGGGRYDFAIEAYGELVEKEPRDASHLYNLALAQMNAGNKDEAARRFQELTERHKSSPWSSKAIGHLLKLKSAKTAGERPRAGDKKIRFSLQPLSPGGPAR